MFKVTKTEKKKKGEFFYFFITYKWMRSEWERDSKVDLLMRLFNLCWKQRNRKIKEKYHI